MKFEFSLAVKAVPAADVKCSFECNTDELSIMLSDPVYQKLGEKLVNEISFAPKQEQSQNHQLRRNNNQQKCDNDRFDRMRKVYETDRKNQDNHNKAVETALRSLQDQVNRMLDRIIKSK